MFRINNYIINTPVYDILSDVRLQLTNGKLATVRKTTSGISVPCPVHSGGCEQKNSCYVMESGGWHCFSCGEHGNFTAFIAKCFDTSLDRAKAWLIQHYGTLSYNTIQLGDPININKNKIRYGLDKKVLDTYQNYCPYLQKRGISRETCELLNIKYDSKYRQIIFPCFDTAGRLIMLPKRSIDTKQFYLDLDSEKPLYCFDKVANANYNKVMLVEGLIDTATCYEHKVPAVGTLGAPSVEQIAKLNKSYITELYIATDQDEAGKKFRDFIKSQLTKRILIVDIALPKGRKDVNDLSNDEWQELILKYHLPQVAKF